MRQVLAEAERRGVAQDAGDLSGRPPVVREHQRGDHAEAGAEGGRADEPAPVRGVEGEGGPERQRDDHGVARAEGGSGEQAGAECHGRGPPPREQQHQRPQREGQARPFAPSAAAHAGEGKGEGDERGGDRSRGIAVEPLPEHDCEQEHDPGGQGAHEERVLRVRQRQRGERRDEQRESWRLDRERRRKTYRLQRQRRTVEERALRQPAAGREVPGDVRVVQRVVREPRVPRRGPPRMERDERGHPGEEQDGGTIQAG
jgi:hypothetical protein